MIEIRRDILTKYGPTEATFTLCEDGKHWVGLVKKGKVSAVMQAESIEEVEEKLIRSYGRCYEMWLEMEANPHKGKVDGETRKKLIGIRWWKEHKN